MPFTARAILTLALAGSAAAAGCASAPAERAPAVAPAEATTASASAGVRFMHDMIAHHAQALELAALVPSRTAREDMHRLAERIAATQADEIALMRRWLEARGAPAPVDAAHAGHGEHASGHAMPGMLTPAEIAALAALRGAAFERSFLESMIRHHEGALVMAAELSASGAASADVELFQFASAVDADQRAEIARMRRLLASFPQ